MGDELIAYLQQLEIIAFFSGYPLVYAVVATIKNTARSELSIKRTVFKLLPFVYGVTGLLYVGLQLRNFYPNYSPDHLANEIQIAFYAVWGFTSLIFFIPLLNKKPVISLLHSLVFFYLLVRSYISELSADIPDKSVLKNYMKVYFDSIILNVAILITLFITYTVIRHLKRKASKNK